MSTAITSNPTLAGFENELQLSWQRFCDAATEDEVAVAADFPSLPVVWSYSTFVTNWCIRWPHKFIALVRSGCLETDNYQSDKSFDYDHQLQQLLAHCENESQLDQILRQFRQQQMVQIAWLDLAGISTLESTIAAVSALADACIEITLTFHSRWLQTRFGTPRDESNQAVEMVILGLGKLGGGELNYSSDVDLIFAYDGSGKTDGNRVIDNQEYFIKLGRKVIHSLDRVDADGFVFRTDLRLRPNGDSGPLVLSFAAMEHYYQTHGRSWERYAWIKARVIAGDDAAGSRLITMLQPFVYRKYLDFSAFDALREMKSLIVRQLQAKGVINDIKLGRGGIREIEFLAQCQQLIRGGRDKTLQSNSLYQTLDTLVQRDLISEPEKDRLLTAYRFLRNVEHRLQMVADRQTQKLPEESFEQHRLASSMGFENWNLFLSALEMHQENVHQQFDRLLRPVTGSNEDHSSSSLNGLWLGQLDQENSEQALQQIGFTSSIDIPALLEQFRQGSLYQAYSHVERDRLDRLMPLALKQASEHQEAGRSISAFISVIEAIGRRSVYLSLLIENPAALRQLLHLCAASPWIARHIGQHPVVLDELLQPFDSSSSELINRTDQQVNGLLQQRLQQIDASDEELRMNTLREFHHGQVLLIAAADIRGDLSLVQIQGALTRLATVILQQVLEDAVQKVTVKHGPPPGDIGIIAYGKLAGDELGYHSDLDIVVCFEPDPEVNGSTAAYYFSKVGQRFIHLLTTRTHAGILFELDMRLRPSGRSGTLVVSMSAFEQYQMHNAWTWEHQALVRAKLIVGNNNLAQRFETIRANVLCTPRDSMQIRVDIVEMRQKMITHNAQSTEAVFDIKLDSGGIVDIEFILQYLVLINANIIPQLTEPRNSIALVDSLHQQNIITNHVAESLQVIFSKYLQLSLQYKLMDLPVLIHRETVSTETECIRQLWQQIMMDDQSNGSADQPQN